MHQLNDDQIRAEIDRANHKPAQGESFRDKSYTAGVEAALKWVLGESGEKPMGESGNQALEDSAKKQDSSKDEDSTKKKSTSKKSSSKKSK